MSESFKGIFAALTTPFEGEKISIEKFKENIQKYNSTELAGYVISGSTGESIYLTDDESEKLVKAAKEAASAGKKIIAGTARESTKVTLEFTNRIAGLEVDAALIRTPSYFKARMDKESLKKHYLSIADQSKTPVFIYHIPQITGLSIDPKLVIELSSHHNIIGMKDSSGNLAYFGEVKPLLPPDFDYLLGAGSAILPGLTLGASGGILRLAAIAPAECVHLYNLFHEGKLDEAKKLQLNLVPVNKAIIQTFGIPGTKYALDLRGFYGGLPRLPLLPLDEKGKKNMEGILKESGLLAA
ncbi:MAG: dihydrodipicolinate synthase family protein [Candidatus Aminicenantes bacterium]|nr:MAG: dihydrodipicolinate synthase family protein [Candidatus Aminicenantes bacterium]